jgi:hypothetical protein
MGKTTAKQTVILIQNKANNQLNANRAVIFSAYFELRCRR